MGNPDTSCALLSQTITHMITLHPGVLDLVMAASENLEQGKCDKKVLARQASKDVALHETTQKMFKFARAKDKQVDLKKELGDLSKELCRSVDERHNTALHYAA